jgi:hypothetical protein
LGDLLGGVRWKFEIETVTPQWNQRIAATLLGDIKIEIAAAVSE